MLGTLFMAFSMTPKSSLVLPVAVVGLTAFKTCILSSPFSGHTFASDASSLTWWITVELGTPSLTGARLHSRLALRSARFVRVRQSGRGPLVRDAPGSGRG